MPPSLCILQSLTQGGGLKARWNEGCWLLRLQSEASWELAEHTALECVLGGGVGTDVGIVRLQRSSHCSPGHT